jgi:hypothetical protein
VSHYYSCICVLLCLPDLPLSIYMQGGAHSCVLEQQTSAWIGTCVLHQTGVCMSIQGGKRGIYVLCVFVRDTV